MLFKVKEKIAAWILPLSTMGNPCVKHQLSPRILVVNDLNYHRILFNDLNYHREYLSITSIITE